MRSFRPSWVTEAGTVENTNDIIRTDMPRKTDIGNYTPNDIDELT